VTQSARTAAPAARTPGRRAEEAESGDRGGAHAPVGRVAVTLAALGVVFGDIGTSPLYALQTVFSVDNHAIHATQTGVYGVVSLVFWAITIIVSVKYLTLIMRADNHGEGGIMALIALVENVRLRRRAATAALVAIGIFGASLFYGDGMITPAISVLSAVEGLEVVNPAFESLVVPVTVVILTLLFAIQRFGTGLVGRLFGPVMAAWFTVLALAGLREVLAAPGIVRAVSPTYAVAFLVQHGSAAFIALGAVVLTVTGAEALYADMGHFGRSPIRRAWFVIVFPALILNYAGQGALILRSPAAIANPFFLLLPHWARMPTVLLATMATVIASQAVISGAFSVTRQAVQLGFLPRIRIRQTSEREAGQIYVRGINWLIYVAVIALVLGFRSSQHLASAYGIAVTGTLAIDTLLFLVVLRALWRKPVVLVAAAAAFFLTVDLAFFSANLPKVLHGGWFPLLIAAGAFTILSTWRRGRDIVTRHRTEQEGPLREFVDEIRVMDPPVQRCPGTAVFLNANPDTTPLAMRANVEHNHTLHEAAVIMSVQMTNVPRVGDDERIAIDDLGYRDDGITHVTARYGFKDDVDVPRALRLATERGVESGVDLSCPSYFLSQMTIVLTRNKGMRRWRKRLFVVMSRNAASPSDWFRLPDDRTVTLGSRVEL